MKNGLNAKEVGFNTVVLEEIVRGGPDELKKAERKARKLAKLYGLVLAHFRRV